MQESCTAWEKVHVLPGEGGRVVGEAVGQVMHNGQVERITLGIMGTPVGTPEED